jgi:hypothetical protein
LAAEDEETTVAPAWEVEEVDRPGKIALEGGGALPKLPREFEFEFEFDEARNVGKRFLMAGDPRLSSKTIKTFTCVTEASFPSLRSREGKG